MSNATKMEVDDDLASIKVELLNLVQAYDNGISEADLSKTMATTSVEQRMHAINSLTNEGKIQLCKRGSDLVYRAINAQTSTNHSAVLGANISIEERAVYQVVESAGSKGIWNREIRNQTKLPLNQMGKVLKNLETKKLIKAVKSVTASKKKLYMLYDLEPDKSVTGGAWYSGTEFESEYVQILYEQCYQFVRRRLTAANPNAVSTTPTASQEQRKQTNSLTTNGDTIKKLSTNKDNQLSSDSSTTSEFARFRDSSLVTSLEVKEYIEELKISNVKLTLQDIETVLETIVFDGLIEKITIPKKSASETTTLTSDEEEGNGLPGSSTSSSVTHSYRALARMVESAPLMRVPCGQCPYVHECRPGAVIRPDKCLYFERWFAY